MTKYRVTLRRQVWQEATLYIDAPNAENATNVALYTPEAIWHDQTMVKNTLEGLAERSEDVDKRGAT